MFKMTNKAIKPPWFRTLFIILTVASTQTHAADNIDYCDTDSRCLDNELLEYLSQSCITDTCNLVFSDFKSNVTGLIMVGRYYSLRSLSTNEIIPEEFLEHKYEGCDYFLLLSGTQYIGSIKGFCDSYTYEFPRTTHLDIPERLSTNSIKGNVVFKVKRSVESYKVEEGIYGKRFVYEIYLDENK